MNAVDGMNVLIAAIDEAESEDYSDENSGEYSDEYSDEEGSDEYSDEEGSEYSSTSASSYSSEGSSSSSNESDDESNEEEEDGKMKETPEYEIGKALSCRKEALLVQTAAQSAAPAGSTVATGADGRLYVADGDRVLVLDEHAAPAAPPLGPLGAPVTAVSLSARGTLVAVTTSAPALHVFSSTTTSSTPLTTLTGVCWAQFCPRAAFERKLLVLRAPTPGTTPALELCTLGSRPASAPAVRVLAPAAHSAAWSPDGRRIAVLRADTPAAISLAVGAPDAAPADWRTTPVPARPVRVLWPADNLLCVVTEPESSDKEEGKVEDQDDDYDARNADLLVTEPDAAQDGAPWAFASVYCSPGVSVHEQVYAVPLLGCCVALFGSRADTPLAVLLRRARGWYTAVTDDGCLPYFCGANPVGLAAPAHSTPGPIFARLDNGALHRLVAKGTIPGAIPPIAAFGDDDDEKEEVEDVEEEEDKEGGDDTADATEKEEEDQVQFTNYFAGLESVAAMWGASRDSVLACCTEECAAAETARALAGLHVFAAMACTAAAEDQK